jgi:predicted HicB family RNase H-like nuclease
MVRPPTKPKPKSELLGVRIPAELKRALENAAVANGRTLSALVQKILVEWAKRQKLPK